jgi:hypothetical protein
MTEAGYYYLPLPSDSKWEIYGEWFEEWLKEKQTGSGLVFGIRLEDALEDESLLDEYILMVTEYEGD